MKCAIIGAYDIDSLEFHLVDSLRFLGHEARVFDLTVGGAKGRTIAYWLKRFSTAYDRAQARHVADRIVDFKPDMVIGVYRHIHPDTITIIKSKLPSAVVIHINPDQMTTLQQQQIIASPYDFYFTKDPFMLRFMRNMAGLNAHFLPEAFNPRFHSVTSDSVSREKGKDEGADVLVFGGMYPYRSRIIEQIIQAGYAIRIFGNQSKYLTPRIAPFFDNRVILGAEKAREMVNAKIVLNCMHYAEVEGVNVKYFEINGVGGFQLCDRKESLREYSPIAPERYSYTSIQEAIEQIRYYLDRPGEREDIRQTHREHFLAHHTYEHRLQAVLQIIG